jgi:hypothetical protein
MIQKVDFFQSLQSMGNRQYTHRGIGKSLTFRSNHSLHLLYRLVKYGLTTTQPEPKVRAKMESDTRFGLSSTEASAFHPSC